MQMMRKLVFQSDFGLGDGAVSAMKGIAYGVDGNIIISDVTHDISPFNIWEASYRLFQVVDFWPEGTVFVSVVDPGVGSDRKSVVVRLTGNRYVVTPDNGTLTHLFLSDCVLEMRLINESVNRLQGSDGSHTFHGRDVYAYTGARLASGVIGYEDVGERLELSSLIQIDKDKVQIEGSALTGTVEILDVRFGHLWTDITDTDLEAIKPVYGDMLNVVILHLGVELYHGTIPFCKSFNDVNPGDELAYVNSMMNLAVGIHQGSFAKSYGIKTGPENKIRISVNQAV